MMAEPVLAATRLAGTAAERVLLVVGPSLGTVVPARPPQPVFRSGENI